MTTILAVDAATQACSAALLYGDKSFSRYDITPRSHTKTLLPMIDQLLEEAGITLANVDALAFTNGPGSFTGIRIGFGVIQGLAFGADIPVIPIGSLHLLAATAVRALSVTEDTLLLPAFDARMDEVYGAQLLLSNNQLAVVQPAFLSSPENAFVAENDNQQINSLAIGDGWNYAERIPHKPSQITSDIFPQAVDLLPIALTAYQQGTAESVDRVELSYLRDTVSWKKRQRLRA